MLKGKNLLWGARCAATLVVLSLGLGCALAPIYTPTTGRSLGKGKNMVGLVPLYAPSATYAAGVTEDLDVGGTLEANVAWNASVFAKYAFVNQKDGFGVSWYGGIFKSFDALSSFGFFTGPIFSYRIDWFEPFGAVRYNYVQWNQTRLTTDKQDSILNNITVGAGNFNYMQYTLGANFWFRPEFALALSAHMFGGGGVIPQIALIFGF